MTKQQLYTRVRRHLLTQKKRSGNTALDLCLYHGPRGLRCAIGCLIPDDKYSRGLEGQDVQADAVRQAAGLRPNQVPLAKALQKIHDEHKPKEWEWQLQVVAHNHGLRIEP